MKKRDKLGRFCSLKVDIKNLYDLYVIQKISPTKIAKLLKISNHTIYDKIHELGWFKKITTRNNCLICGKLTFYKSKYCINCYKFIRKQNSKKYFCKCGNEITRSSKSGLCKSCSQRKQNFKPYWTGDTNKNITIKHHIDGNKKNNKESNFLKIAQGKHRSLHWRGYEYLVEIGLIYDYLKDFCLKYEIVDTKDKIDGKVVHHIDCSRENNNEDNFMYLKDKKIHNKLHQEAYLYLVRINRVNDYISWFLLREEEKLPKTEPIEEAKKS
jgi:hypothetical protein